MRKKAKQDVMSNHGESKPVAKATQQENVETFVGQEQRRIDMPELEPVELEPLDIKSKLPKYRGKASRNGHPKCHNREKQAPEAEKQGLESDGISMKPGKNGNIPPVEYRFKPGQSGNPKGRPPSNETLLKAVLKDSVSEMGDRPIPKNLYPRAKEMMGYARKDKIPAKILEMSLKEFVARHLIWEALTSGDPRFYAELSRLLDLEV